VKFSSDQKRKYFNLEKLLPEYFKLARLLFMNQYDPLDLADKRDKQFQIPNLPTTNLIKLVLKSEYQLYDYIQQRFDDQYRILTQFYD
jgi:hypothetical protein